MVGNQLALPVTAEVKLRAVAGGAFNAVAREVELGRELADMAAERPEAEMQAVCAGFFQHLADLAVFFYGGGEGAVAHVHVVLFNDVDQDLDNKVLPAFFLDALDDLGDEAGTVLEGLRAVLVVAVVAHTGEEGLADVVAGCVDFNRVEALLLEVDSTGDKVFLQHVDLFQRQVLCVGGFILCGSGRVKARKLLPHAGELIADVCAFCVQAVCQFLEGDGLFGFLARIGEIVVEFYKVFHPDHFHAAVGKALIVGKEFIRVVAGVGAGCRFYHAVAQLNVAELPGREDMAEVGVFAAVIVVLRIQLGDSFLRADSRRFICIGLLAAAHQAGNSKADGSCRGAFQKVTPGNLHGHIIFLLFFCFLQNASFIVYHVQIICQSAIR